MKKIFTILALTLTTTLLLAQTQVTVTLDTKKFVNIDCSLGADGTGGASPLQRVYMHSGLCTTGDIYCKTQIIPLYSMVWEHVVGNWGANPQDDGIGEMTNEGNGVFSKSIIIEDYFSGSWVSTDWNENNTIQSTPMPAGATPYTLGLVFRSPDGLITGRDNMCNDIFVTDLNTENPKVIQSFDLQPWPNSPVTINKNVGIAKDGQINFVRIAPNPVIDNINIEFYLKNATYATVSIKDAMGRTIAVLLEGNLNQGKHLIKSNIKDFNSDIATGFYYVTIQTDTHLKTEKLIITK